MRGPGYRAEPRRDGSMRRVNRHRHFRNSPGIGREPCVRNTVEEIIMRKIGGAFRKIGGAFRRIG